MAKRSQNTTSKMQNKLKKGIGQGHGSDYVPWLTVRDVPSKGLSTRIRGWKTGRVHHFLSKNELYCYYAFEWASDVTDIREQFPLDLETTIDIASRLGVRHPSPPKTEEPSVMTTDFLLTVQSQNGPGYLAVSVKQSDDLSSKRVLEKQAIESLFWAEKKVPWYILTEREIPGVLARNVEWIHTAKNIEESPGVSSLLIQQAEPLLYEPLKDGQASITKVTSEIDERLGLEPGSCLWIVRYLIANKVWIVDMETFIQPKNPLVLIDRVLLTKEAR